MEPTLKCPNSLLREANRRQHSELPRLGRPPDPEVGERANGDQPASRIKACSIHLRAKVSTGSPDFLLLASSLRLTAGVSLTCTISLSRRRNRLIGSGYSRGDKIFAFPLSTSSNAEVFPMSRIIASSVLVAFLGVRLIMTDL